jgi:hypothetical protein
MQNASSASHRKRRHRKRPEARRNPSSSSLTADPPPPSRCPPLLPAAGQRIKSAASLPSLPDPAACRERGAPLPDDRAPLPADKPPDRDAKPGEAAAHGKASFPAVRGIDPGSVRATGISAQEHVAGPPPEECLTRRRCCSFTSRVAGDANYLLCLRRLLDGDFTPKCIMPNPFLGLGLLVGDGLVVPFAHFLNEKNRILTCHRSSGGRRGGSKP